MNKKQKDDQTRFGPNDKSVYGVGDEHASGRIGMKSRNKSPEDFEQEKDCKFSCSCCGHTELVTRSEAIAGASMKLASRCCGSTHWCTVMPDGQPFSPHKQVTI